MTTNEATGVLIAESIKVGTEIDIPGMTVHRIRRVEVDDTEPVWTLQYFTCPDEFAQELAEAFSTMLREEDGWYADFGNERLHWVIFSGKVMTHIPGDAAGRALVEDYAVSRGLRREYLDWKDATQK